MHETTTMQGVVDRLRILGSRHIAVDGGSGIGKTTLAQHLAAELSLQAIHLDDFVAKDRGAYFLNINLEALAESLARATEGWVMDGVCMLEALDALAIKPDALIYIKIMAYGYWSHEDELDPKIPIEQHMNELRDLARAVEPSVGKHADLGLTGEVARYHAAYRPHNNATITFLRTES